jgi:hypothetical protein
MTRSEYALANKKNHHCDKGARAFINAQQDNRPKSWRQLTLLNTTLNAPTSQLTLHSGEADVLPDFWSGSAVPEF